MFEMVGWYAPAWTLSLCHDQILWPRSRCGLMLEATGPIVGVVLAKWRRRRVKAG
jgi:hypothetical protein